MSSLHLLLRNLTRRKIRTGLTLLSIFVAFVLFGVLAAVRAGFGAGIELAGIDRLILLNKVSIILPLPLAYKDRIAADPDVELVTHANWFGGVYQDERNFFAQFAVEPESFLDMYPEYVLPPDEREAFLQDRTGAVVGRALAERFDWKVGDRIPIRGVIYQPDDGSNWEFTLRGIYDGDEPSVDETIFMFHYDYLDEAMGQLSFVGWYVIRIRDPQNAVVISERVDARFANSSAETKTTTESAFIQAFADQTGNISGMAIGIGSVAFVILLLVAGNTLAHSVRERIPELGVLKTLGFRDGQVMTMVLAESCLMAALGGLSGLFLTYFITRAFKLGGSILPTLYVPNYALAIGIALIAVLGLVSGLAPALLARRLKIVDALRRG
jgi:putative ABC transport system permease protein